MYLLHWSLLPHFIFAALLLKMTATEKIRSTGSFEATTVKSRSTVPAYCVMRNQAWSYAKYQLITCTRCYLLLKRLTIEKQKNEFRLRPHTEKDQQFPIGFISDETPSSSANSSNITITFIPANVSDPRATDQICATLSEGYMNSYNNCQAWVNCCDAAMSCCDQASPEKRRQDYLSNGTCHSTWDGLTCVSATESGVLRQFSCPSYIRPVIGATGERLCNAHGQWRRISNYAACLGSSAISTQVFVELCVSVLNLLLLAPALFLFMYYNSLRRQQRIRIHINLFLALFLSTISWLTFDWFVIYDSQRLKRHNYIHNLNHQTFWQKNLNFCVFHNLLSRYLRITSFIWMFLEGYYLHNFLVNAFHKTKTLIPHYLFGWGMPFLCVVAYAIIRWLMMHDVSDCWNKDIGGWEYIMHVPTMGSILANMFFLSNIIRIIFLKLQAENEPGHFRRTLRAVLFLMPLFGLQQIVLIYKTSRDSPIYPAYLVIHAIISYSQGSFVALIFCFFNNEVHSEIRRTIVRRKTRKDSFHPRRATLAATAAYNNTETCTPQFSRKPVSTTRNIANSEVQSSAVGNGTNTTFCSALKKLNKQSLTELAEDESTRPILRTHGETFV